MKRTTYSILTGILFSVLLASCNLPSASQEISLEMQAGTLVAQTLQANQTQQAYHTPTLAFTPTIPAPTATLTPAESPTPTATTRPLIAPGLKKYDFFCTWNGAATEMQMTIKWTDKADNETGYRVYLNGAEVANLGANTTIFTGTFIVIAGQPVSYAVEAYNNGGPSGQITITATCQ